MTSPDASHGGSFCGRTRREFLWETGARFTSLALTGMLTTEGFLARQSVAADGVTPYANPLAPKPSHFAPKAKSVIFLFMYGGPSHVDTFDYKPELFRLNDKTIKVTPPCMNHIITNEFITSGIKLLYSLQVSRIF